MIIVPCRCSHCPSLSVFAGTSVVVDMSGDTNVDAAAAAAVVPSPSGKAKVGLSKKAQALKDQHKKSGGKNIRPKLLVTTMCKWLEEVTKPNQKNVPTKYDVYAYPKGALCTLENGGRMYCEKKSGFHNPVTHLTSCYFRGDKSAMEDTYWEALSTKRYQSSLDSFLSKPKDKDSDDNGEQDQFAAVLQHMLSAKDKEVYEWIEAIVKDNLPLSSVRCKKWRQRFKHEHCFSERTVIGVMITLTYIVTAFIKDEMAKAPCGSLMHDAWSKFGGHYFALLACFFLSARK